MHLSYQLDEIERAARYLLDRASTAVIRIDGPMGAGKTTLISAAVKILGVTDTVSSPTFSLVNNYQKENEVFYHFDFYRLNHPDEALDIGLEEYLESGHLCLLEWAEKVSPHLPLEYDHFIIEVQNDESRILKKLKH
jgi:tRNA threonylcarbamoyladenosine biosynthesis protein TsaE